jgi:hypothetical protein
MSATLALFAVLSVLVIIGALAVGAVLLWLDHRARRPSPTNQL